MVKWRKNFTRLFGGFVGDVRRATSISSFRRLEQRIPAACIHGIFEENENAHATLATSWRISPCIGKYPGDSSPPILSSIVVSSKPRFQLEIIRTVSLEKKSGKSQVSRLKIILLRPCREEIRGKHRKTSNSQYDARSLAILTCHVNSLLRHEAVDRMLFDLLCGCCLGVPVMDWSSRDNGWRPV